VNKGEKKILSKGFANFSYVQGADGTKCGTLFVKKTLAHLTGSND